MLANEINSGPLAAELAPHVAAGNDGAIAEILNTPRYAAVGPVSRAHFAIWAASGPRSAIEDHATNPNSPLRASALTLKDFLIGAADSLELDNASVAEMLSGWLDAGAITQGQHDALLALGARTISRAEQIGMENITAADVARALRG